MRRERRRAELAAEWVRITVQRDFVAQVEPLQELSKGQGAKGGTREAARNLGMSRDQVARSLKVAALSPESKEAARPGLPVRNPATIFTALIDLTRCAGHRCVRCALVDDPHFVDRLRAAGGTPGLVDDVADVRAMPKPPDRIGHRNLRAAPARAFEIEMMRPDRREQGRRAFHVVT